MDEKPQECSDPDCDRPIRARGMCSMHYARLMASQKPCIIEGCEKMARCLGMCSMHYYRLRRRGEAGDAAPERRGARPCKVEPCSNLAVTSDDLCPTHRRRKNLYGQPDGSFVTHKMCVTCGEPATWSRARTSGSSKMTNYCRVHYADYLREQIAIGNVKGHPAADGYVYHSILKRSYPEHRIVMEHMLGRELMPGENVHHKNGVRHDNSPENLELWVVPQVPGRRVEDLIEWVCERYPNYIANYMAGHPTLFAKD